MTLRATSFLLLPLPTSIQEIHCPKFHMSQHAKEEVPIKRIESFLNIKL